MQSSFSSLMRTIPSSVELPLELRGTPAVPILNLSIVVFIDLKDMNTFWNGTVRPGPSPFKYRDAGNKNLVAISAYMNEGFKYHYCNISHVGMITN
jgi:hypothetical protein